jgi:hypothetical protein
MTFGLFLKKFSMVSPLHPHEYSLNSLTPTQNREIGDPISMGVPNGFKIQPLTGHLLEFTSKFIGKAEGCQSALLTCPPSLLRFFFLPKSKLVARK